MKIVEITVAPGGETKVETKGFSGRECREASRFLEAALGTNRSETFTSEFYGAQSQYNHQTQQE